MFFLNNRVAWSVMDGDGRPAMFDLGVAMIRLLVAVLLVSISSGALAESQVCSLASTTAAKAAGGVAAATAAVGGAAQAAGLVVVAHSSGSLIAAGAGGYVAGTLGAIGTTALSVVSAPAVIIGTAAAAVAVGGTVAYCSVYDPPQKVRGTRSAVVKKPK